MHCGDMVSGQAGFNWSWLPGVIIAAAALGFTVASFWWMQARQGRLRSWEPQSFAFFGSPQKMHLRLPLVLYNDGAKPIVVQDLRLSFPTESGAVLPLPWGTSRSQLNPKKDDGHQLPGVFAVPGRTAQQHFVEFGGPFPGIVLEARDYHVLIQARIGHKDGWQPLLSFPLRVRYITEPDHYIAYSNAPADPSAETMAKANAALRDLMDRVRDQSRP